VRPVSEGLTSTVFDRYAQHVIKVQVLESRSGTRSGVGSGFFVSDSGHIVTNYHVVSALVHHPDRYRAEMVDGTGVGQKVTLLAIDVVHDLAVLGAAVEPPRHFVLDPVRVTQGDRLYSLGHPHDLGLSIVEGTYNGLLQHTLYPKIHFTGSINPGMSGGPAITAAGQVVGINVSTSGDQVSFLVPVERAAALVKQVRSADYRAPANLLEEVARQLREYQDVYLADLFTAGLETVEIGQYRVATQPAPFFRCWGDANQRTELLYQTAEHSCSTDDYLFIAEDQQSGVIDVTHQFVTSTALNTTRFFALYTAMLEVDNTPGGTEEHVTSWRCGTRNLRNAAATLRAILCLRRYRKLGELYDAVLKVAVLGQRDSGLVSTLTLSGASFENVSRLTNRYLEHITWR
jgi:hypothetical protein